MTRPNKTLILILAVLMQITLVFALPNIDSFKAQFAYPSNVDISWKVTSAAGLTRLELFEDSTLIFQTPLKGGSDSNLYQIPEDNLAHVFQLNVYDMNNQSTSATFTRGSDKISPNVTGPVSIISNQKTFSFMTNEPSYCKAGLQETSLVEVNKNYELNHTTSLSFSQGSNLVFIKCVDSNGNEMKKSAIIVFQYDTLSPEKPSNVTFFAGKISWTPPQDSSGIERYNIYNSVKLIASTNAVVWTPATNDSIFFISAVDKAGNEGAKAEYDYKREMLLAPQKNLTKQVEVAPATQNVTKGGLESASSVSKTAWIIFGVLVLILIIWKVYEYKSDKHGLRKYLKHRRKMRDLEAHTKL